MRDRTPRVPDAEMDVLVHLRRAGSLTAAELVRALSDTRPMTHGSAATLLGRLERKGLVSKRKAEVGKAFVFTPTAGAERALRGTVQRLVARVFGGDRIVLVASLLDSGPLDDAEVTRLEQLVSDLGAARAKRKAKP